MQENAKKTKILTIDDNQGILFIMKQALEIKNYEVEISDSFRGIESIKRSAPDLILLDISLTDTDGGEACRKLKSNEFTKHIPIIILSGNPDLEKVAGDAEADDYLAKPFNLVDFYQKIKLNLL